ncbi:MAG: sarcosine oxidase subunit alpha family protein [Hyphomicrobiaceae bacterium]
MSAPTASEETQRHRASLGGRIDRSRVLRFTFDGVDYRGHPGDTLASALLANGVHLVGRSFKYHRPRGILSAGSEEPNALVTVARSGGRATPNQRATTVEIYAGLAATSQNRWPSLSLDAGAINDKLAPVIPAGFYYKTFMGPGFLPRDWAWTRVFEPLIRRAAGLGQAPREADPDSYASRYAHCDVLVVGAGPAGLAAATAAADQGAGVIIVDEQNEAGGSLLSETQARIDALPADIWIAERLAALLRTGRVQLLERTTAFGIYPDNMVGLAERLTDHVAEPDPDMPRERLWQVRAREIVLAAGAIERPLVFPGNDRPGVMLAGAAFTYAERYGVRAGRRVVIACASDTGYRAALALKRSGAEIVRILDRRRAGGGELADMARQAGMAVETSATVSETAGRLRVASVKTVNFAPDGSRRAGGRLDCDLLLMSAGWTPTVHLYSQARGKLTWDGAAKVFVPGSDQRGLRLAGACRGVSELADVLADGYAQGAAAAQATGHGTVRGHRPIIENAPTSRPAEPPDDQWLTKGMGARAFIDFQNDVTVKDIRLAAREGFRSIEHMKRYTTTGMATDQGKTSNLNALEATAGALGTSPDKVGHTTFRAPYTPVTFGTLAGPARGAVFDPVRRTPIDGWARAHGAVSEDVGQWQRARYFPRPGEDMQAAVARECRTVRESVGLFDASTLGKIEVVGPDAATFLDRMYVNALKGLGVGRCRYAVLLNEAGFVIDDGIVARLAADRFHVTTTTGGAQRVLAMMEDYLQTEFTDLTCWLTSVTEQYGVIAVQGPKARETIAPLVAGVDLSDAALPHMGYAGGEILGVPMRLFRVSFTGELGYEINVPAREARRIWEALQARVTTVGGTTYGTEAMHVLRAEKGYIIVGQESDGTLTPGDLGQPQGKAKADFVGKRALSRPDMLKPDRPQLVGLLTTPANVALEEGAQVTTSSKPALGTPALGHVTSAYMSPALGRSIALAVIAGGRARCGETLYVPMPDGASIAVQVVDPVFYDAKGERLHG